MLKNFKYVLCFLISFLSLSFAKDWYRTDEKTGEHYIIGVAASGYPPLQYHDEKGDFVGYDVDFFNEVGKLLDVKIRWIHPNYNGVFPAIVGKTGDFAPGFVETKERKKKLFFSNAYFQGNYSIIVAPNNSPIKTTKDIIAKTPKIAVVSGSFQDDLITSLYPKSEHINLNGNEDIVLQIQEGKAEAGILPYSNAQAVIKKNGKNNNIKLIGEQIPDTGARIVINYDNTELQEKLNNAIDTLFKNGKQKKLHKKWYPDTKYRKEFYKGEK
ncbi:MAG: arginine ABC transporter substrate-binding protein [Rickettsiales bacterium]|nr:MAG: arginine ABC transporter substrate-binding protein [Rickettsiales bacterium]